MAADEVIVLNDKQTITKLNEKEYLFTKTFSAKMSKESRDEIVEALKVDIAGCTKQVETLNEENYNKGIKEIEDNSVKIQEAYKKTLANPDEEIRMETKEEFEKRKVEELKDIEKLIEHSDDALNLTKDKFKVMFENKKEQFITQLKQQEELLKIYTVDDE